MKDRFKFRCWNTIVKGFVPIIMNGDGDFSIDQNAFEWEYGDDWDYVWEKENNTLEQCTGLKDKNGKLIYEGDILSVQALDWHKKERWDCEKVKTYWSVEYKNYWNHCGFMVFGINRRFHKPLSRTVIFNSEAEVIGNIHENPELLKESK